TPPARACGKHWRNAQCRTLKLRRRSNMHLLKPLAVALIAAMTMTSCAIYPKPVVEQPQLLPVEYATQCPAPAHPASNHADDMTVALKEMYDLYGICAGRLIDVVDWIARKR